MHTVETLVLLVKDLLDNHKLNLKKFQTDNLEARFGQYIMLSDTNYIVSVKEIIQSEKKNESEKYIEIVHEGVIKIKEFMALKH